MRTPVTTRRTSGRRNDCSLAASRKPSHRTPRTDLVKGLRELSDQYDELSRQLDALHAEGVWSGPRHAALCEAVSVVQRGLQSVRRAVVARRREKGREYTARWRAAQRQRSAESRRVA